MTATYTEILAAAKDALLAILQGKLAEYNLNGVHYTYHNLQQLKDLITGLESVAAAETSSSARPRILPADISGRPG